MPPCHAHFHESFSSDLRTIKVVGVVYISNNTLSFLNVITWKLDISRSVSPRCIFKTFFIGSLIFEINLVPPKNCILLLYNYGQWSTCGCVCVCAGLSSPRSLHPLPARPVRCVGPREPGVACQDQELGLTAPPAADAHQSQEDKHLPWTSALEWKTNLMNSLSIRKLESSVAEPVLFLFFRWSQTRNKWMLLNVSGFRSGIFNKF